MECHGKPVRFVAHCLDEVDHGRIVVELDGFVLLPGDCFGNDFGEMAWGR
jgi:hypothetical protein